MPRPIQPYVSMPVVYCAIGGGEFAAIVTDVRPEGVCLTTFLPSGALQVVTRVPFESSNADLRPRAAAPFCYFVSPPSDGFEQPPTEPVKKPARKARNAVR